MDFASSRRAAEQHVLRRGWGLLKNPKMSVCFPTRLFCEHVDQPPASGQIAQQTWQRMAADPLDMSPFRRRVLRCLYGEPVQPGHEAKNTFLGRRGQRSIRNTGRHRDLLTALLRTAHFALSAVSFSSHTRMMYVTAKGRINPVESDSIFRSFFPIATSSERCPLSWYSPAQPLNGLFFSFVHLLFCGQRLYVYGELIVEEREAGQSVDDAGIRPTRPPLDCKDRVVASIEIESNPLQPHSVPIPAVLLD